MQELWQILLRLSEGNCGISVHTSLARSSDTWEVRSREPPWHLAVEGTQYGASIMTAVPGLWPGARATESALCTICT